MQKFQINAQCLKINISKYLQINSINNNNADADDDNDADDDDADTDDADDDDDDDGGDDYGVLRNTKRS